LPELNSKPITQHAIQRGSQGLLALLVLAFITAVSKR